MRLSTFHMIFDLCYLASLCAVILITFYVVFLPAQPAITILSCQTLPVFQHTTSAALPIEIAMLCAIASLIYLKCIWRIIYR